MVITTQVASSCPVETEDTCQLYNADESSFITAAKLHDPEAVWIQPVELEKVQVFTEFIATHPYPATFKTAITAYNFTKTVRPDLEQPEVKAIALIEVDSELGAGIRGQSQGTAALKQAVVDKTNRMPANPALLNWATRVPTENLIAESEPQYQHAKHIDQLYRVLVRTRNAVAATLQNGLFPVVLAGDHSTAAGTIAGIKQAFPDHRLGVIWIDAHADIHSPYTTPSGNMHGMPLAIATSTDHLEQQINTPDAATIDLWKRCQALGLAYSADVSLNDLVYVAVRETEAAEDYLMATHQILNFTTETVRHLGAEKAAQLCLEKLADVDLIYVSFDVDSMDASVCMGTGTPASGGLFVDEARQLNQALAQDPRVCCWEICEINPLLDTLNTVVENSHSIFEGVIDAIATRLPIVHAA